MREALSLFRSACDGHEGDACYFAARLVAAPREGLLDPRITSFEAADTAINASLTEAAGLFRMGCYAERPSAAACNELGNSYTYGLGRPVQLDSAIKVYQRGCTLNSATACSRLAVGLEDHPELGPQRRLVAFDLMHKACDGGSPTGCANLALVTDTALFRVPEAQRETDAVRRKGQMVAQSYRDSCTKGIAIACNNVGSLFDAGRYGIPPRLDMAQRKDSARHYYELACAGMPLRFGKGDTLRVVNGDTTKARGVGFACRNLGNLGIYADYPDTAAAVVQYRRGCLLFDEVSCAELALKEYMLHHDSADVSLLRTVTACNQRIGLGCNYAGWLLREPAFNKPDQSMMYFRRACDLNYAWSCFRLGDLEDTPARKAKYHRRACELHEGYGCFGLASILESDFSQQDRAVIFYDRACDESLAKGCWEAKRLHRMRGDLLEEGRDRARACRIDKEYCKKADPSS